MDQSLQKQICKFQGESFQKTLWIWINAGNKQTNCVVNAGEPTPSHVANAADELTRRVVTLVKFSKKFGSK